MPACRATKAEMARALQVWQEMGLPVGGMEVLPDGTIRILAGTVDTPAESAQRDKPKKWSSG